MKALCNLFILACVSTGISGCAADLPDTARSPVLVELFTSEGCSSCPPVDTLLQQMDAAQPFPHVQLIVLSEHVDYWNHDGWKDPYSSPLFTERQATYVRTLGLSEPYTPQLIVDGSVVLGTSDPQRVSRLFEKESTALRIPVHIVALTIAGANPPVLRARIEADGETASHNAEIYLAVVLEHAESQVSAGENNGKRLTHVAVVQEMKKVGKLEPGKTFGQEIQFKLKKGTDPANLRVVALVQETGQGKVLGAASRKSSTN